MMNILKPLFEFVFNSEKKKVLFLKDTQETKTRGEIQMFTVGNALQFFSRSLSLLIEVN